METITKVLIMEHAVFNEVFDQIEKSLTGSPSAAEVKVLATVAEGLLSRHAETETNLAYAALDHALADRGALDQLHQDHHEIDDHFLRIHRTDNPAEALRLLKKALRATRKHFQREENLVFPTIEKTLGMETQVTLAGKWMANHSAALAA